MSRIAVKIRLANTDTAACTAVVMELAKHRFTLRHEMPQLQLVTGDLDPEEFDAVKALPGVLSVEEEPGYQAPPVEPDTPQ